MAKKKTLDLVIELTKELYNLDTTSFVPIKHKKINIGWVNNKNQKILNFFEIKNHCIDAKKLQEISKNKKFYAGLDIKKNYEFCPVFEQPSISPNKKFNRYESFGKNKLFDIERNLLAPLGLPQYGIHANGWRKEKSEYLFYFAIRSKQIKDFPGLYDNIFAGGQPSKLSIHKNLKKEALEESGIRVLNKNLKIGSSISYIHNYNNQIHSGTIFVYDYELDKEVVLKNRDGEVQKFETISVTELYEILEKKLLKPNCIIPIADFFLRNMRDFFPNKGILELEKLLNYNDKIVN